MASILAANNLYAIINNEIDYFTGGGAMENRNIRKIILLLIVATVAAAAVHGVFSSRHKISKEVGDVKPITGKYQKAYYKQTKYSGRNFYVVFDDPLEYDDSQRSVRLMLMDQKGITEDSEPWSIDTPPNTVFEINLTEDQDNTLRDGKDIVTGDFTVTTVMIPTGDNSFSAAYIYFEIGDSTPTKRLVKRSLNDYNDGITSNPPDYSGTKIMMTGKDVKAYAKKYNMKLFEG